MRRDGWIGLILLVLALSGTAGAEAEEVRRLGVPIEVALAGPSGDELGAQVAVADNGDVLVVWSAATEESFSSEVYGRLYRRGGTPTTPEPFVINAETQFHQWQARVAAQGEGFVVVWATSDGLPCPVCSPPPFFEFKALSARLLDRDGGFRSPEIKVGGSELGAAHPFLLTYPSGELVVLWQNGKEPFGQHGRRFDSALHPLSQPFAVQQAAPFGVVALPGGGFASVLQSFESQLTIALFGPTGSPVGAPRRVTSRDSRQGWAAIGSFGDEGFAVAWSENPHTIYLRRFDSAGTPLGPESLVADEGPIAFPVALAGLEEGTALVIWHATGKAMASFLDRQGQPARAPLELASVPPYRDYRHLALNGRDWALTSIEYPQSFESQRRIVLQRLTAGCVPEATTLCLGNGRFAMAVTWQTQQGQAGVGKAVRLTDDTGGFWFFSEDNLELVTKMLDGSATNGWHWLFAAGLSSVRYELFVLDTETGKTRTYIHPEGPLESRADIRAFLAEPGPGIPAGAAATRKAHPVEPCAETPTSLCLQEGRFRVQVSFVDPFTGETRQAAASPFSKIAGTFSFFASDNVEVFVKIVDGTPVNGHAWVFHAALSDLDYTIEIFDLVDGHKSWSYHNPRGRLHSAADTDAF